MQQPGIGEALGAIGCVGAVIGFVVWLVFYLVIVIPLYDMRRSLRAIHQILYNQQTAAKGTGESKPPAA